jgi:hypothetical protein
VTRRFATTQWNVVLEARDGSESRARQALESLCHAYWFPLYVYVRSRGNAADEARDLTQAFFADLLDRNFLEAIDRSKGRFRSFMLASLEHFRSNQRDKANALRRAEERNRFRWTPSTPKRATGTAVALWQAHVANQQRARAEETTEFITGFLGATPTGSDWALRDRGAGLRVVELSGRTIATSGCSAPIWRWSIRCMDRNTPERARRRRAGIA